MTKIVCDICGKECYDKNKFIIPIIEPNFAISGRGIILKTFYSQNNKNVNLCPICQTNIANFIKILKESNGISG